jgi:hypothetical protein
VGSALAFRGIPLQSAYCGAKHALEGFLDSVRTELLHEGSKVVVTSVHLPAMNTPQFRIVASRMPRLAQPVPPIYQPELAAQAVLWAADHRVRELWMAASTVATILGSRATPDCLTTTSVGPATPPSSPTSRAPPSTKGRTRAACSCPRACTGRGRWGCSPRWPAPRRYADAGTSVESTAGWTWTEEDP